MNTADLERLDRNSSDKPMIPPLDVQQHVIDTEAVRSAMAQLYKGSEIPSEATEQQFSALIEKFLREVETRIQLIYYNPTATGPGKEVRAELDLAAGEVLAEKARAEGLRSASAVEKQAWIRDYVQRLITAYFEELKRPSYTTFGDSDAVVASIVRAEYLPKNVDSDMLASVVKGKLISVKNYHPDAAKHLAERAVKKGLIPHMDEAALVAKLTSILQSS